MRAEKVNAVVWATEWGLTVFCVASAFAGIVATRTAPTYLFLLTSVTGVLLAACSFILRGKLRTVFRTQYRAEQETTGRFRIEQLYGSSAYFPPMLPAANTSAGENTQRFSHTQIEEYFTS